jgi:predicted O-methyltransferase YrrM
LDTGVSSTPQKLRIAVTDPKRAVRGLTLRAKNARVKGRLNPNSTTFARDARPGPVALAFNRVKAVPGWFTYDDAAHFTLVLRMQTAAGIRGDILEIGPYHGRSTAILAGALVEGERLTAVDPFQSGEVYVANPPTPERLLSNVTAANPGLKADAVEIIAAYSTELELADDRRFRFVHIDGSHERDVVLHDLTMTERHLLPGGVVVLDDYDHPDWPGVTEAISDFRKEHPEFTEVADLNRHAESGRKLYLTR